MGLLNFIPPQYKMLAYGIAAVLVFSAGMWKGYSWAANKYQAKIVVMEVEREQFVMQKQELANRLLVSLDAVKEVIVTKYVDRVKVIKEKEYVYNKQAINNVPNQFELSNGWVYLHDSSARGDPADPARSSDATPSGVADNQALAIIVSNNSAALQNAEQLRAVLEIVRETNRVVEEANAKIREINKKNKKKNRWNN